MNPLQLISHRVVQVTPSICLSLFAASGSTPISIALSLPSPARLRINKGVGAGGRTGAAGALVVGPVQAGPRLDPDMESLIGEMVTGGCRLGSYFPSTLCDPLACPLLPACNPFPGDPSPAPLRLGSGSRPPPSLQAASPQHPERFIPAAGTPFAMQAAVLCRFFVEERTVVQPADLGAPAGVAGLRWGRGEEGLDIPVPFSCSELTSPSLTGRRNSSKWGYSELHRERGGGCTRGRRGPASARRAFVLCHVRNSPLEGPNVLPHCWVAPFLSCRLLPLP